MLRFLLWSALILFAGLAVLEVFPPAAAGPEAPAAQFSGARAIQHLPHFATKPHPIGSAENAVARDYLVAALTALGGEVRVERTVGLRARGRFIRAGNVENIVARFAGRANQRAVMLVAHYDSVPQGPGAADDGAGVISILETVRTLRAGPPLQNDVLVLLTDGEEPGLLGSAGFAANHPDLARQVGVILNLEARGTSGPALMFETSVGNGWLIRELAQAAPSPLASSLMYAAYQLLPNDTDLSELKRTGVPAMNFAFTETIQGYHTRLDTKENLDPRSVQHLGANVLGLSRRFGNLPLTETRKPDCVYFDWLGYRLVHYPMWLVWVIALATFALLLAAWLMGRRDHVVTLSFTAIVAFLLLLGAVASGMLVLWSGIEFLLRRSLLEGDTPSNHFLIWGIALAGFVIGGSVLHWLDGRLGALKLHFGLLLFIAVASTLSSLLLPGASYVFQWPVLFGAASLILSRRAKTPAQMTWRGLVAAVPSVMLLAPLAYLFFENLGLNSLTLLALGVLISLLLSAAWPLFAFLFRPQRTTAVALATIALGLLLSGAVLSHPSALHPQRDSLRYGLSADQGKAKWISSQTPDAWTQKFLGKNPNRTAAPAFTIGSDEVCLNADAPPIELTGPAVNVVSDRLENGIRRLRLHLMSTRGATTLTMRLPTETELEGVSLNGRSIDVQSVSTHPWLIRYEALPSEGVEFELRLRGEKSVSCWVGDTSNGFPPSLMQSYPPRPEEFMADLGSDTTLVTRHYSF